MSSMHALAAVKCATTANITLSGAQTIDVVSAGAGDRVLVKDQTTVAQNGVYVVAAGAWARATDMDSWDEVPQAFVNVQLGAATSVNSNTNWICTSSTGGTLETTDITWTQFSPAPTATTATIADGSVTTAKLANDAVDNTKLANMATKTYKGRTSGGTGDPEDVAAATVRTDADAEQIGVITGFNTQTASYTMVLTDKGKVIEMNVGSANNLTIPTNANVAYAIGTYISIHQLGTGQTTIVPDTGVSLSAYNSGFKLTAQHAVAMVHKRDTNAWIASGNLTT